MLSDTPVIALVGPRQSGKTTLARALASPKAAYVSLDDELTRNAAIEDATGLLRDYQQATTLVIDEIQRAPDLLIAIKASVDQNRRPGRFILTGSAHLLTLPRVHESLAGRMETAELFPLSQSEIANGEPRDFFKAAFGRDFTSVKASLSGDDLIDAILVGGFPEVVERRTVRRRSDWHRAYVSALIDRDIPDIASIEKSRATRLLVDALAHVSGQLIGASKLGAKLALDHKTVKRYSGLLEQVYLVSQVPAWFDNALKRLVSTPKLHFFDSGLLATLRGSTRESIRRDRKQMGPLLETFVYSELRKCASWSDEVVRMYHYRDKDQIEVDFVIENAAGDLIGIEVKAAATVGAADFRGITRLQSIYGERLVRGFVLYDGVRTVSFGERLLAAPISTLWR